MSSAMLANWRTACPTSRLVVPGCSLTHRSTVQANSIGSEVSVSEDSMFMGAGIILPSSGDGR